MTASPSDRPILYYAHDPMCSWCWAFRPAWDRARAALQDVVAIRYLLGGLAPDTTEPMPADMQAKLQSIWEKIRETVPGTEFNFDFWERNTPRRSTYAACRAVIAARRQETSLEDRMILAIQKAYYREARNPADRDTLIALARELGLDRDRFAADLDAPDVHGQLQDEIDLTRRLGVQGFPSLILETPAGRQPIAIDFRDPAYILSQIAATRTL